MKEFIALLRALASILFFMIWILIINLNLSSITQACTIKRFSNNIVVLYDCRSRSSANRFSKADYIFNLGEELNPRLSSKRFQVLPHGIFENFGKSFSEKTVNVKLGPAFPKTDVPIDISSLLI